MRNVVAIAAGSVMALAGFAGAAHASATIDLIWDATGTEEINDDVDEIVAPTLNVILKAGPAGSQGAAVSVDFSGIADKLQSIGYANSIPGGSDTPLPIALNTPLLNGSRVELINAFCFCDFDIGTGLAAGESYQLGTVTFGFVDLDDPRRPTDGVYEVWSDVEFASDGVLDGDANVIPEEQLTFNTAFLTIPEPAGLASLEAGIALLALLHRRRRHRVER